MLEGGSFSQDCPRGDPWAYSRDEVPLRLALYCPQVLMAELLPLINTQEPGGPPCLALCRAAYSLLCEGGEHFLTVLRDDPAD